MKKVISLLLLSFSFALATPKFNECITDIYFGNGVWNDYQSASLSRDKLEKIIKLHIYNNNSKSFRTHHFSDRGSDELNENVILLSFNWTGTSPDKSASFESLIIDLIETYFQLKDNGQVDKSLIYYLRAYLAGIQPSSELLTLWEKIEPIVGEYSRAIEGANLAKMIADYENISLKLSHRVLLVAHSQGNLFGNEVYANLTEWEKRYFKMVSVGTPADNVLGAKNLLPH